MLCLEECSAAPRGSPTHVGGTPPARGLCTLSSPAGEPSQLFVFCLVRAVGLSQGKVFTGGERNRVRRTHRAEGAEVASVERHVFHPDIVTLEEGCEHEDCPQDAKHESG